MQDLVYLDYAATTPVDPRVAEALASALLDKSLVANPSAVHPAARLSEDAVRTAVGEIGRVLNCDPDRLFWTSGATESDNLAVIGAAHYRRDRGTHLVTMKTEHKAVTDAFESLEKHGFDISWLLPGPDGILAPDQLAAAITDRTQLVSIMHVNNETGVIQDIEALGRICREHDVLFHVDAAQSFGKLPIDLQSLPVDMLSVTAHKIYGPKGIGALYIADRPGCHVEPILFGGGQQRAIRPGTLPVPLIVAFGEAAAVAELEMQNDYDHVARLNDRLWSGICDVDGIQRNGAPGWPGILSASVTDIEGESLLLAMEPVCVATGSACNSRNQEPSYVLRALGLDDLMAQSALRFSFGRFTSEADIDVAIDRYRQAVANLRRIAPAV